MSENTTQLLLVARVDRLISLAEETSTRLQNMEERLQNMEERLQNLEEGQHALKTQLENLDAKVEKRLQNTRPIWEAVQSHLASLDARTAKFETDLSSGFRGIDRKIGVLSKNLVDMTAEIRELQDRVEPHPV